MASSFFPPTIFTPDDLIVVGHVHTDVCEKRGIEPDSPEAEQIAITIIAFFQSGIKDEATLGAAMGLRKSNFPS
jgi:hypothetical protein